MNLSPCLDCYLRKVSQLYRFVVVVLFVFLVFVCLFVCLFYFFLTFM